MKVNCTVLNVSFKTSTLIEYPAVRDIDFDKNTPLHQPFLDVFEKYLQRIDLSIIAK